MVFVDESGDHSLTSIDPAYPVFVLSFCVFERDCYISKLTPAMRALKFRTFGHDLPILHESDIRNRRGAFSNLGKEAREGFMASLTELIDQCDFTLIPVVVDKRTFSVRDRHMQLAHPYHLAMQFGLEQLNEFLAYKGVPAAQRTFIICEARGKKEDAELELAFRRVCDGDNRYGQILPFDIVIADKRTNCEGLQLADLTARPVGLSVVRPAQNNRAFGVLSNKVFPGRHRAITGKVR
ncbi:MAG: DUF3800 domain-containing protein [Pseudomonadota bacterium]